MLPFLILLSIFALPVLVFWFSNGASFERGPIIIQAQQEPSTNLFPFFAQETPMAYPAPQFKDRFEEYRYYTGHDHPDLDRIDPLRHFQKAKDEGILGLWDRLRAGLPPTREQEFYWNWITTQQPDLVDADFIFPDNGQWH